MTVVSRRDEMLAFVDAEKGVVDRKIFSDQEIYELELERIFARAWVFMCHDSQIPNPGDFFSTTIGEDRVICVRDLNGQPQVLINTCRHRGNAVCRADEGHATSFMCTYHGWTYDLKGNLVGVPGYKEIYHQELNRSDWGLGKAAQVANYRGFNFATMAPEAPSLDDYLGDVGRVSLDVLAGKGNIKVVGGIQRYTIPTNWKFAVDNVWDAYHPDISHASAFLTANGGRRPAGFAQYWQTTLGKYGHAEIRKLWAERLEKLWNEHQESLPEGSRYVAPADASDEAVLREKFALASSLGPVGITDSGHLNVFPTLWVSNDQLSFRVPKGPMSTEVWWMTLLDPAREDFDAQVKQKTHQFGPGGLLEQEDGENWGQSTRGTVGVASRRLPLNYAMNLGHGEVLAAEVGPPRIYSQITEHAQLWFYRAWADWISTQSWADFEQNHTPVPMDHV